MHYTLELFIDLPRDKVIELFDNPDNLKKWQPGLQSFEHFAGEAGMTGAKSKLRYKMGKREIEMIETIIVRDLPDEFSATYEANGVWNEVKNFFQEASDNQTLWRFECTFKFSGFMRLIGFLMPGTFRKQSFQTMQDFKAFAESATN